MDATAPRVNRPVKLGRQDRQKILRSDRLKSLGDLSNKICGAAAEPLASAEYGCQ